MSGDKQPDDDADFLDEDFVVEDLGGQGRDLDDLFDVPVPPTAAEAAGKEDQRQAAPEADEDDLLFTDDTSRLGDVPAWQRAGFEEQAGSTWDGETLDLESVGVPNAEETEEELAADPQLDEARTSFAAELDSMLQGEDEFALDSEAELELIGGESDDGISEFEQSGPFVLDDGEGLWSDDVAASSNDESADEADGDGDAAATPDEAYAPAFAAGDLSADVDADGHDDEEGVELSTLPLYGASGGADDELQDGWEPLPGTSMDELAEVDEVQRSEDELRQEAANVTAPNFAPVAAVEQDLDDVDGHDIYEDGDLEPAVIGGPGSRRGRWAGMVSTLLAATVILGGGAVVIARPEWFGLRIEPQRVERVELPRPRVDFAVSEPAPPMVVVPPVVVPSQPDTSGNAAGQGELPVTAPGDAPPVAPDVGTPDVGTPQVEPTPVVEPTPIEATPIEPTPMQPTPQPAEVLGTAPSPVAPTTTTPVADAWPDDLNATDPVNSPLPHGATEPGALARFGEGLMVGSLDPQAQQPARAIDGVLPGSRAFAQLHNGNYFIGSVKQVAAQTVTLRVEDGEVTLATADIAQLTELGSADYEDLQKATKGFVRLTNNNRLVGGILSRIADDHVVLEFRKNRVMLPRSAVGEIVSGEGDQSVRLDTTREEDGWVRRIAERQLGTGLGSETPDQQQVPAPRSTPPK